MITNHYNKKGSAMIIAIICMIIVCMIMIYFIEKLMPISKNIKGIENSTIAYYNAVSGVENALYFMRDSPIGAESGITLPVSSSTGYSFQITASGSNIPITGEGNSEYDQSWNIIGVGRPVQLAIPTNGIGTTWDNVKFRFMVSTGTLSTSLNGVINWILSGKDSSGTGISLYASGDTNMITRTEINGTERVLDTRIGFSNTGTAVTFNDFYTGAGYLSGSTTHCDQCVLKLSIVSNLVSSTNEQIPYLEYQISLIAGGSIPLQYARIESDGYSYGFRSHIRRDVKQSTTSEALDFTISQ